MIRFVEIGFIPILKSAFPDETLFVDTRLSWEDGRGHQKAADSLGARLHKLWIGARSAISLSSDGEMEAVIVRSRGPENTPSCGSDYLLKKLLGFALHRLARHLARKHNCKLAVIDRADEATIHPNDLWILRHCDLYFKRELPWSVWSAFELVKPRRICIGTASAIPELRTLAKKLTPLSLGVEDHLMDENRELPSNPLYDIFYIGKAYDMKRRLMIENDLILLEQAGLRVFRTKSPLSRKEFLEAIRSSRIAISPGGVGWDCFRHYEIPACGTAMLIERPSHQAYNPPEEGIEAIYYSPSSPMSSIVRHWLSIPKELDALAAAGRSWVQLNHTYSALGRYIDSEIRRQ